MTPARAGTPPKILVVDDEQSIRDFVERVLAAVGYEVTQAMTGAEALDLAVRAHPPFDLYVIDLVMPAMRGDELAGQLRQRDPEVKVLYFTGFPSTLFGDRHLLGPREAFVEKPVSAQGLMEAVSLLLFGHIRGPS